MKDENFNSAIKGQESVPYIIFEGEMARSERHIKRLWIVILALVVALLATNIAWLVYESQFETIYWEQDGGGVNNINTGEQGDVVYEPEREISPQAQR